VGVLPAGAVRLTPSGPRDPMPGPQDPAEFLGIDVQQLAGDGALVLLARRPGLQGPQPCQATRPQQAADGGATDAHPRGDLSARPALLAQGDDLGDDAGRRGAGAVMGARGAARQRVTHFRTVRSVTPTARATARTRSPPSTRWTICARPWGVNRAFWCTFIRGASCRSIESSQTPVSPGRSGWTTS
jgi:hypothetical protein